MNFACAPNSKLTRQQRIDVILDAGVQLANAHGLRYCRADRVATACSFTTSKHTVYSYFWTNNDLWRAIAKHPKASDSVLKEAKALRLV